MPDPKLPVGTGSRSWSERPLTRGDAIAFMVVWLAILAAKDWLVLLGRWLHG